MANKIPCEIIQDLLPSYMDGLTNEVTNQAIEEHVETCDSCRDSLYAMKTPVESEEEQVEKQEEKQEIDFLKKSRRKHKQIAFTSIVCGIVAAFVIIFVNIYGIGEPVDDSSIDYIVSVDNEKIRIDGELKVDGQSVRSIDFYEENGVVTVVVKSVYTNIFNEGTGFTTYYYPDEIVNQVVLGDCILWENGTQIDALTNQVFQSKHPYIGDMSANGETVRALHLQRYYDFSNELLTTEEPYEWILMLNTEPDDISLENIKNNLESRAYVMLAVIDNLGVVTFQDVNGNVIISVNAQNATERLGQNIKDYGNSVSQLQELMETVGLVTEY